MENLADKKPIIGDQERLEVYDIIETQSDKPQELIESTINAFEDLFSEDLIEFIFESVNPSVFSKLHNISRIKTQNWNSDGTANIVGIMPKKIYEVNKRVIGAEL